VVPLSSDIELPDGLTGRNADDRILAVAYQVCNQGCQDLLLVTNDLNMLLQAQALGISVERRAELEGGWTRKYIVRPFQRYRVPLTILAIALAVFAGVLALAYYTTTLSGGGNSAGVPTEFRDQLSEPYRNLLDGLIALQNNGTDAVALAQVGNAYYGLQSQTGNVSFAQKAISYYERYLNIRSDDTDVRTDMAAMFFYSGATDRAIQEATTVLQTDPNHVNANFNLGIFYWKGRSDFKAAALQFKKVIELTKDGDAHTQIIAEQAKVNLIAVVAEAKAAGQELDADTLGIREYLGGTI
jgi:tetratricopeptide (TPR) repeat protein